MNLKMSGVYFWLVEHVSNGRRHRRYLKRIGALSPDVLVAQPQTPLVAPAHTKTQTKALARERWVCAHRHHSGETLAGALARERAEDKK